ncbi:alpha/beta fold hydrolase [Nakamurella aerolata]|uniref:Alpha/beta hydrolase n=1 Tax=Nakamurella aerolata TaxID=1656892 RepID=A0A849A1V5_9ACTN|nr:alpha/beta hydrolase [Nakamurella aerolata]NNG35014.1 alpha/beta hydrolase [Nakamurella aerolata]
MEQTIQNRLLRPDGSWVCLDGYGDTSGPGLVIVPGVMSDASGWRQVASSVTAWPSVWVVNRRGRTPSGPLGRDYSMATEVGDLSAVLEAIGEQRSVFGWSYGGLITLLLARNRALRQVIAYEPVDPTFGNAALPSLRAADAAQDWDAAVRIVNEDVSGFSAEYVRSLRTDEPAWATLRRLSVPLYRELSALSRADLDAELGSRATRIDLIIGSRNVDSDPYGAAFRQIENQLGRHTVTQLPEQGHLAHLEAPVALGRLLDQLAI